MFTISKKGNAAFLLGRIFLGAIGNYLNFSLRNVT
jgi:hypothetical protein